MRLRQAKQMWSLSLVLLLLCGFLACSPVSEGGDGQTGPDGAAILAVSTNTFTIQSNAESVAVITAQVLNDSNAAMEGVTVQFATDTGLLNSSTAITDENGRATVQLQSGPINRANRNVTVSARVIGVDEASTIVQVTGTTVTPSLDSTSVQAGTDETVTLTVAVRDASQSPMVGIPVQVTTNAVKSSGSVSPGTAEATTGNDGTCDFVFSGGIAGEVVLTIAAAGVTVDTDAFDSATILVGGSEGGSFRITTPAENPTTLSTDTNLTIEVDAPGVTSVLFTTTLGQFENSLKTIVVAVTGGTAEAMLTSSSAGTATVQAANVDGLSPSDTVIIAVAADAADAAKLSLQGSRSSVAPSTGDVENSITLTATVTNSEDEPVSGATVVFSIENPTGYGEFILPAARQSNSLGEAETTFTSGREGSDTQGVRVWARVVGMESTVFDDFDIVVGGEPGSIMLGRGTTISSIQSDTAYSQPMTVVVADAAGNPVSGAQVTLSTWPARYWDGYWTKSGDEWVPVRTAGARNEDVNENLRLDEDTAWADPNPVPRPVPYTVGVMSPEWDPSSEDALQFMGWSCTSLDGGATANDPYINTRNPADPDNGGPLRGGNGDGILTPPNSSAGTLPASVTTDEDGKAQFNLVYAKASAVWVEARITATTSVLGTETKAALYMTLPYLKGDAEHLDSSPFDLLSPIQSEVSYWMDWDGDGYLRDDWDHCPGTGTDCDDFDADINPGVAEDCTNGIDDNCNGAIDGADGDCP